MRENRFSARVSTALRNHGAMVYPIIAGQYSPAGWPDKLVVHPWWMGLIEIKSTTTPIGPLQIHIMQQLNAMCWGCAICYRRHTDDEGIITIYDRKRFCVLEPCSHDEILETIAAACRRGQAAAPISSPTSEP